MNNNDILLGSIAFACIPMILMFHVYKVGGYNNRVIQLMLIFIGSISLWGLMITSYTQFVQYPVPKIFGFLIFPISSLFVTAFAIYRISKIALIQKRKNIE